jgi:small subunit ribosomal protein S9
VTDETPTPEDEAPREDQAADGAAAEEQPVAEEPTEAPQAAAQEPAETEAEPEEATPVAEADTDDESEDDEDETPRVKPAIPGADLEVDIVEEGADPLAQRDAEEEAAAAAAAAEEEEASQPIASVAIDLGADARYRATGKRKTAVGRIILKPGTGAYEINGKTMDEYFPRPTLQKNIRQPLEAVGLDDRMDVIARMHGGGVSAQAGALRHGISRALLEADPNLRGELKKRGFLTRDARAKERKKAGLKKARKRPQFSKR